MIKRMKTVVIETYRPYDAFSINRQDEPSCVNNYVRIRRYRVTWEEIVESNEVLAERLQKLWENCTNWHYHNTLLNAAKELDYELVGAMGAAKTGDK